jgi:hypothetical protein
LIASLIGFFRYGEVAVLHVGIWVGWEFLVPNTTVMTVDNHVPGSQFNRLNHTVGLIVEYKSTGGELVLDLQSTPMECP